VSAPKPGQWVVVARGPGERALVAAVESVSQKSVYFKRSPFRVGRLLVVAAFDESLPAHELAQAIDGANGQHLAAMEKARAHNAERWKATVARLVERATK
jgi:hypothetical protein